MKTKTKKKDLLHDDFTAAHGAVVDAKEGFRRAPGDVAHFALDDALDTFFECAANYVDVLERRLARIAAREKRAMKVMDEEAWAKRVAALVVRELRKDDE